MGGGICRLILCPNLSNGSHPPSNPLQNDDTGNSSDENKRIICGKDNANDKRLICGKNNANAKYFLKVTKIIKAAIVPQPFSF